MTDPTPTVRGNWRPETPTFDQAYDLEGDLLEKAQTSISTLTSVRLWGWHTPADNIRKEDIPSGLLNKRGTKVKMNVGVYDTSDAKDPVSQDLTELSAEQICQGLLWMAHDYLDQILAAPYPGPGAEDIPVQPGTDVTFTARFHRKKESGDGNSQIQSTFKLRAVPRSESRKPSGQTSRSAGSTSSPTSETRSVSEATPTTPPSPPSPPTPGETLGVARPLSALAPLKHDPSRGLPSPPRPAVTEDDDDLEEPTVMRTLRAHGVPTTGPGVRVSHVGLPDVESEPERPRSLEEYRRRERRRRSEYDEDLRSRRYDPEDHRGLSPRAESEMLSMMREISQAQQAFQRSQEALYRDILTHNRGYQDQLFQHHIDQQRQIMAASAHAQAELRATIGCINKGWQDLYGVMTGEVQHARDSANRANERLFQLNPMDRLLEHQDKANEQGWKALMAGIELRENASTERLAHQHQIYLEQTSRTEERHRYEVERMQARHEQDKQSALEPAKPGGGGKWFRELLPIGAAIAAVTLKTKGHDEAANLVIQVANEYTNEVEKDEEGEEDEEDEDDTQVVEVEARPSAPVTVPMAPRPKKKEADQAKAPFDLIKLPKGFRSAEQLIRDRPIVALLRMLLVWLDANQKSQLKEILGVPTWAQIEAAGRTDKEGGVIVQFGLVRAQLENPELRVKVDAVLSPQQREMFNDLIEAIKAKLA